MLAIPEHAGWRDTHSRACLLPTQQHSEGSQDVQEHRTPGFLQGGAEQLDGNFTGGKNSFGTTACAAPSAVVLTASGLTESHNSKVNNKHSWDS